MLSTANKQTNYSIQSIFVPFSFVGSRVGDELELSLVVLEFGLAGLVSLVFGGQVLFGQTTTGGSGRSGGGGR